MRGRFPRRSLRREQSGEAGPKFMQISSVRMREDYSGTCCTVRRGHRTKMWQALSVLAFEKVFDLKRILRMRSKQSLANPPQDRETTVFRTGCFRQMEPVGGFRVSVAEKKTEKFREHSPLFDCDRNGFRVDGARDGIASHPSCIPRCRGNSLEHAGFSCVDGVAKTVDAGRSRCRRNTDRLPFQW